MGLDHCALRPSVSSYLLITPGGRQDPEYEPDCEWKSNILETPPTHTHTHSVSPGQNCVILPSGWCNFLISLSGQGLLYLPCILIAGLWHNIWGGHCWGSTLGLWHLRRAFYNWECDLSAQHVLCEFCNQTQVPILARQARTPEANPLSVTKSMWEMQAELSLGQHLFRDGQDYSLPWKKKERQKKEMLES